MSSEDTFIDAVKEPLDKDSDGSEDPDPYKGKKPVEEAPRGGDGSNRLRPRRGKDRSVSAKRQKIHAVVAEEKAPSLSIFITFVDGTPLPAKEDIVEFYRVFGILNTEKTQLFPHLHAAIVVYENKDVEIERALDSSVRESSSFKVERVKRYWMTPKREQVGDGNSDKADDGCDDDSVCAEMKAIREKLERAAATLDKYYSEFTDEGKNRLKELLGNIMEMAEKVEKLVDDMINQNPN